MSITYKIQPRENWLEISLSGAPLSQADFKDLQSAIEKNISNQVPNIVLDLGEISLLNSEGLNALIKIMTRCRNNGGDLWIVNISKKINQVLLLTKLNTVLNIAPSVKEAAAHFAGV
jgi:anti-sigma B factor antagonist